MWNYNKEIAKIKNLDLNLEVLNDIIPLLEALLPESSVCEFLNIHLKKGTLTQSQAYEIMDILGLIDMECIDEEFIDYSLYDDEDF